MAQTNNLKPWRPGQSGNVKGKPKGSKNLSTRIKELLNDKSFEANVLDAKKGLVTYKGAPMDAIIKVSIARAVNGDEKAREWLAKYGYGRTVDLNPNEDNEIIVITRVMNRE